MRKLIMCGAALLALNAAADNATLTLTAPDGRHITVTAVSDNIIKVTNTAPGEQLQPSQTILTPATSFTGRQTTVGDKQMLTSPTGLTATLDGATGELTINAGHGRGLYDSGRRTTDADGNQTFQLLPIETTGIYYGGGERGYNLNLAGDTLVMYNRQNYGYTEGDPRTRQMNITMPLLVSPNGYALLFDDYAAASLVTNQPMRYTSESPESVSYYFVTSPDGYQGVAEQLSLLTGRQDLPPFWSLGYITSKYGYKTRHEADSVISTLKKNGYPVDGIVLDLYWYGIEQDMGRLEWDADQWPDHRGMLKKFKDQGVNLVAISQPYVLRNGRGLDNYNYLAERGMFGKDSIGGVKDVTIWVGEGGMFDVSNPDTRAWLTDRYRALTDEGITGWWGDLGEPEVHPANMHHANGLTTRLYHNLYGNDWSRIIYDLFKEQYPDRRLMTLMRGGTVGLQRYSVYPWSTDVSRSWGGLQPQVKIMLNSSASGLGYMSHDVGGFATVDSDTPWDPELYVRWLQLGLFTPILRTHAQSDSEPYLYTEYQDIIKPLVKERYAWLPYNYSLAYDYTTTGRPFVRNIGTYTDSPADYADVTDQYLWGSDLMIAPVMNPGVEERSVRFPAGTQWVEILRPANVYDGGTTATVKAPLSEIPVFARAGALVPKAPYAMKNTGDFTPANYTVDYYPTPGCGASSFTIFEDDRTSPSTLERGDFGLLHLSADNTPAAYTLKADLEAPADGYHGMPAKRTLTFVLHNVERPAAVVASAGKAKYTYDAAKRTLSVAVSNLSANPALTLTITK